MMATSTVWIRIAVPALHVLKPPLKLPAVTVLTTTVTALQTVLIQIAMIHPHAKIERSAQMVLTTIMMATPIVMMLIVLT